MPQVKEVSLSSSVSSTLLKPEQDVFQFLIPLVEKYPQIVAIYAITIRGVIDLWTVIAPEFDQAEEILAEIDVKLLQQFPHLEFDFMTLYKEEEPLVQTQLQNSDLIYSKNALSTTSPLESPQKRKFKTLDLRIPSCYTYPHSFSNEGGFDENHTH